MVKAHQIQLNPTEAQNLANLALPTNQGEVKPVEQTHTSNLLDSVAMNQEIILNNLKF